MKGREALRVTWDEGEGRDESSASLSAQFRALAAKPGKVLGDQGDVDARIRARATTKVDVDVRSAVSGARDARAAELHRARARRPLRDPRAAADADVRMRRWSPAVLGIPRESVSRST